MESSRDIPVQLQPFRDLPPCWRAGVWDMGETGVTGLLSPSEPSFVEDDLLSSQVNNEHPRTKQSAARCQQGQGQLMPSTGMGDTALCSLPCRISMSAFSY